MRVLIVSWEYPPVIEGGLGRHVRKLSESLAAQGVEVHVLTRGEGGLPRREERHGVLVHRVRQAPFPRDVDAFLDWVTRMNDALARRGEALIASIGFDAVHSHDWLTAAAGRRLARRAGRPWVCTIHATEYGRHQGWVGRRPQSLIHARERRMARSADALITCSEYMRTHVETVFGIAGERITAIPNGVDPRDLSPVSDDLAALRARFARPDEHLVLLVGRLVYEKGFHLALDALAAVAPKLPRVRFVLAGTGTAEAELKAQAARLGLGLRGTFLGWVGDDMLHSLYRVADLCVVPSIYEPFGIVALEAMASGCLCIVADTGGLREVVPAGDMAGLRFAAKDADALREALERVLGDPALRTRLVAEARRHVLRFDWAAVAAETAALYARLPAGAPAAPAAVAAASVWSDPPRSAS